MSRMHWQGLAGQSDTPDASVNAAPIDPVAADNAAAAAEAVAW
jgi:hypothetical protein